MKGFTQAFNEAYKKVATTAEYSMDTAIEIGFGDGIKAIDMPKEMADKVVELKGGCCFHHSWRLIHELQKVGIVAYWACVPEPSADRPKDQKCVVVYETEGGKRFVADVIEDIKAGVKMEDYVNGSCKWINDSGEIIDNSKISLNEMARISDTNIVPGYLHIYPKPTTDMFFEDYLEAGFEEITCEGGEK